MSFSSWTFKRKLTVVLSLVLLFDVVAALVLYRFSQSSDGPLRKLSEYIDGKVSASSGTNSTDKLSIKGNRQIVSAATKKLEQNSNDLHALSDRCEAYFFLGENALAAADAEHLSKLEPDYYPWVQWRAMALKSYDPAAAIEAYSKAIKMHAPDPGLLLGRAACYAKLGKKALCLKDLQTIGSGDLDDATILELADIYLQIGEVDFFKKTLLKFAAKRGPVAARSVANYRLYKYLLQQGKATQALVYQKQFVDTLTREYASSSKAEQALALASPYKTMADLMLVCGARQQSMATYQKAYQLVCTANDDAAHLWSINQQLDFGDLLLELELAQLIKSQAIVAKTETHVVSRAKHVLQDNETVGYRQLLPLLTALTKPSRMELYDAVLQHLKATNAQGDNFERDKILMAIMTDRLGEAQRAVSQLDPYAAEDMGNVDLYLALGDTEKALVVARGIKDTYGDMDHMRAARGEFVYGNFEQAKDLCLKVKGDPELKGEDIYTLSRLADVQKESAESRRLALVAAGLGNQQALLDLLYKKP